MRLREKLPSTITQIRTFAESGSRTGSRTQAEARPRSSQISHVQNVEAQNCTRMACATLKRALFSVFYAGLVDIALVNLTKSSVSCGRVEFLILVRI
jgi:hypothetical protein